MQRSSGIMVNYLYRLADVERITRHFCASTKSLFGRDKKAGARMRAWHPRRCLTGAPATRSPRAARKVTYAAPWK